LRGGVENAARTPISVGLSDAARNLSKLSKVPSVRSRLQRSILTRRKTEASSVTNITDIVGHKASAHRSSPSLISSYRPEPVRMQHKNPFKLGNVLSRIITICNFIVRGIKRV
jgi:hypothetical protein